MSINFNETYTLTADGNTAEYDHAGGLVGITVQGDFGGGTVTLQANINGSWGPATDMVTGNTISQADGTTNTPYSGVYWVGPALLRINLASSTDADIDVRIAHVGGDNPKL